MSLHHFHKVVERWFSSRFVSPSAVQVQAWPEIKQGNHTLLAAPTGSGKTLAAFLAVIDDLVQEGLYRSINGIIAFSFFVDISNVVDNVSVKELPQCLVWDCRHYAKEEFHQSKWLQRSLVSH